MDGDLPPRPVFIPHGFGSVGHEDFVEIVAPAPVSYEPQTLGWYVFGVVLLAAAVWGSVRGILRYQKNAYRRAALSEVARLRNASETERERALGQLPALLKRCALAAFPRPQVAALSGESWLAFLASTAKGVWTPEAQTALSTLLVSDAHDLTPQSESVLFEAVTRWIRGHRA